VPPLNPLDLLVLSLATWRLTSLVVQDNGPWRIFARLRARTTLGGVLECVWCCSVWVAAGLLALHLFFWPLTWLLAISAGAILYDRFTSA